MFGKLRKEHQLERLTMTSDKGGVAFTFNLDITCEKTEIQKILKLAQRLKAYEDTGLEPEEILDSKLRANWVPVAERLPDKPGDYWVAMRHLDGSVTTVKMFWSPDWPHEDAWNEVVVAWQPYYYPEPFVPRN